MILHQSSFNLGYTLIFFHNREGRLRPGFGLVS